MKTAQQKRYISRLRERKLTKQSCEAFTRASATVSHLPIEARRRGLRAALAVLG